MLLSNKDLFNDGKNPFYESFSKEDGALTKMVLDGRFLDDPSRAKVDYMTVVHYGHKARSQRFYVEKKDEQWMEEKKYMMMKRINYSNVLQAQFEYEKGLLYQLDLTSENR